jgi:phosphopantothenoylcysteine decarboxylase/phosphopantothenate--cysteine ligase
MLVANRAQDALGADDNEVTILDDRGAHALPRMDKLALARRLCAEIAARLKAR